MTSEAIHISFSKRSALAFLISILINLSLFIAFDFIAKEQVRSLRVQLQQDKNKDELEKEERILKRLESESFKISSLTLKKGDTIEDKKKVERPTETKRQQVKPKPKEKQLELSQLASDFNPKDIPEPKNPPKEKRTTDLGIPKSEKQKIRKQESLTKKQILNEFASTPEIARILDSKGFNMEFGLPEGLNETDLNSKELIYFAFLRRNFLKYLTTFLTTHNKLLISRPSLTYALRTGPHLLTARAIYDDEGNMTSFKILKSSLSNDIHQLFEETIKGMTKIPNPPRDFVKGRDKEFSVYYQLQINGG